MYIYIYLSIYLCVHLSMCLSILPCIYLSICLGAHRCNTYTCIYRCIYMPELCCFTRLGMAIHSISQINVYIYIYIYICQSICPYICLCVYLSFHVSFYLSVSALIDVTHIHEYIDVYTCLTCVAFLV